MDKRASAVDRIQNPAVARKTVVRGFFDPEFFSEDAVRRKMRLNPFTHNLFGASVGSSHRRVIFLVEHFRACQETGENFFVSQGD